MNLSLEALDLFAQLLSAVKLDAGDQELEAKAGLIVRVRTELFAAIQDAQAPPSDDAGPVG